MKRIAVFGCGDYYKFKVKTVAQIYDIIAVIDNNAADRSSINRTPVYQPSWLMDHSDLYIMIMTARSSFMEIFKQLISMNIPNERIMFGINEAPCYDSAELLISKLNGEVIPEKDHAVLRCSVGNFNFTSTQEYLEIIRKLYEEYDPYVGYLKEMPSVPASYWFGREFGNPVDRFYIENFLKSNAALIHGDVAEMGDNTYTYRFGRNINKSIIFSAIDDKENICVDFSTGKGVTDDMADCLICTQTLQMIFNIEEAITNIYKLLKLGGVALITAHGLSKISTSDYTKWGEYWRFTPQSLGKLLVKQFGANNVEIKSYGNIKTACAFLYGLCQEYLAKDAFSYNDDQFPVIISAVCRKP